MVSVESQTYVCVCKNIVVITIQIYIICASRRIPHALIKQLMIQIQHVTNRFMKTKCMSLLVMYIIQMLRYLCSWCLIYYEWFNIFLFHMCGCKPDSVFFFKLSNMCAACWELNIIIVKLICSAFNAWSPQSRCPFCLTLVLYNTPMENVHNHFC